MEVILNPDELVLDPQAALGTLEECLQDVDVTGSFDNYAYCVTNGRRVLLGHQGFPAVRPDKPSGLGVSSPGEASVNYVFLSKGASCHRQVSTWEALRKYLAEGWTIGTERYPGVKFWFASTGRNSRRAPDRIFVL